MKKILFLILPLLFLMSCKKNDEFALNEKVANEFLKEMNALDSLDLKYFSNSNYLAKPALAENSIEVKDAVKLSENSLAGINNMTGVKVSPEAMSFYKAVLQYLEAAKAQGDLARDFFTETDPHMREGYFESVQENFKKLRNKPDSILTIQKVYLNKVGIK